MSIIAIDLGTTNTKEGCYDENLNLLAIRSVPVEYRRDGGDIVEFEPEKYFETVLGAIGGCAREAGVDDVKRISFTSQAESLVVLDAQGRPARNGISWLDNRSGKQVAELREHFDYERSYRITGQPEIIPTWPITKMLWIRQNEPEVFERAATYMLLKDYVQYKLTGKICGEYSIYNFSHYFDITKKDYWDEILDYVGIERRQLPELIEPCTDIGPVKPEITEALGFSTEARVNVGTLDHFAGMVGTGNIKEGIISESTGTVMSIATMIDKPLFNKYHVGCHYGPFPDSYVLLAICESGGSSLEWYMRAFMEDSGYGELNKTLAKRDIDEKLLFLPYITGTNAPDFNDRASGVFYGIDSNTDRFDMAYAIMEGVAHMLEINIEFFEKLGMDMDRIFATGGGAKSDIWSQLKADITGKRVLIPSNEEAACFGAAIIGAVSDGIFDSYETAVREVVSVSREFDAGKTPRC
jgi:xylulokinase